MILVGSGNMATNLAYAFRKAGVRIDCVYSHQLHHAEELALKVGVAHYTDDLQKVNDLLKQESSNQVVIYCLKDSVLPEVLSCIDAPDAIHLHTAGSMGITVFAGKNKPHCGVLYPFQTLSKERVLPFDNLPIFIEATNEADLLRIRHIAEQISTKVYLADSEIRKRLHLAGVFANNFSNCMYAIAAEILEPTGLSEEVLLSLIDETAAKVHTMPARRAQTGPAIRYDESIMNAHLQLLEDANLQDIYRAVSKNIHENQ